MCSSDLTSVGSKEWDSNNKNTWSTSSLNTYLNNEFITTFDETTKGKIADTTWKVGGNTSANIRFVKLSVVYQNEVVQPNPGTTSNGETEDNKKIGLMYVSDYGFAAAPSAWTTNLENYNGTAIKNVNWMYLGAKEWTISRYADNVYHVFDVSFGGNVNGDSAQYVHAVRPVFYLTSSVTYVEGDGTKNLPIRIN